MARKIRIRRTSGGDLQVIYTVTGGHDVFRWAFHMLYGQVEFCEDGSRVMRYLRRRLGARRFDEFDKAMTGGSARRYSIRTKGGL